MSAHVLLKLLNESEERDKCEACRPFYFFFATSLINSIIQEQVIMYIITFPENLKTTSVLFILLHGVISLPDATSCDKLCCVLEQNTLFAA